MTVISAAIPAAEITVGLYTALQGGGECSRQPGVPITIQRVCLAHMPMLYADVHVAGRDRELGIAGDDDDGTSRLGQRAHDVRDLPHVLQVKSAGRLVEDDDRPFGRQCGRDGDALFLPAGQGQRMPVGELFEVKPAQYDHCGVTVLVRLGEFDLVQHGFGEQLAVHVLHHGEARAQSSAAVQPSAVGRDEHAFASGIQSLQASRERRLAGTVETGHGRGAPGWERRPFHVQRVPSLMPVPVAQ